ncbi:MAG: hypothetical protein AAF438_21035 [Pseudomonadota bacterium]
MLPKHLRDQIWATYRPGQEISKTPSAAYIRVAQKVQQHCELIDKGWKWSKKDGYQREEMPIRERVGLTDASYIQELIEKVSRQTPDNSGTGRAV